jgi:hypothetical protein
MADNSVRTPGSGETIASDEVTDATLGTVKVQFVKLMDGTLDGTTKIVAGNGAASGGLRVTLANDSTGIVSLTTSTASIGKLAANDGVDIGNVDVASVVPGTGATNLGKAEDAGHTTGDVGVMALGVANEGDAAIAGTDLDYVPLAVNLKGYQYATQRKDQVRVQITSAGLTTVTTTYAAGDTLGNLMTFTGMARATGGGGRITSMILSDYSDVIGAIDVFVFRASVTFGTDNSAPSISDADTLSLVGIVPLLGPVDLGGVKVISAHNINIPYDCSGGTSLYVGLVTRTANAVFAGGADSLRLTFFAERD